MRSVTRFPAHDQAASHALVLRGHIREGAGLSRSAYIKDLSPTEIANETLASVLARAAGLPTPELFLADAAPSVFPATRAPSLGSSSVRLVVASADAHVPPIGQRINAGQRPARLVRQWSRLDEAICFDEWIANADRHPGNLLFDGASRFIMIDHSHAFFGNEWKIADLQAGRPTKQNQLLEAWASEGIAPGERIRISQSAVAAARTFGAIDLTEAFRAARLDDLMEKDRREALMDFLRERCNHLETIIKQKAGVPDLLA